MLNVSNFIYMIKFFFFIFELSLIPYTIIKKKKKKNKKVQYYWLGH